MALLCASDYLDALEWTERVGGIQELWSRCDNNLATLEDFVAMHPGFEFLAKDRNTRSNTSVCLTVDLSDDGLK